MKVLLFAEWFANLGGSETFNQQLFLELRRLGIDVLLVTREEEAVIHPKWKKSFENHKENFAIIDKNDGGLAEFIKLVRTFQPDLIHFSPYEKTAWEYFKTSEPKPVILGTEPSDGSDLCYWDLHKYQLPEMIHQFPCIHCVSARASHNLRKYFKYDNQTVVIPPPFYESDFQKWRGQKKKFHVLFAGRIAQEKGIKFLVSSWSALRQEYENLTIDLWGSGPQEDEIRELISKNSLTEYISMKGEYPSFSSIPINDYDMLIIPSLFEGLPYVFMEGMSTGIPVVVTKNCGAKYLSSDRMLFQTIEPENIDELKRAIHFIYDHFEAMQDYTQKRGELIQKKCAVKTVTRSFIDLYEMLIQNHK